MHNHRKKTLTEFIQECKAKYGDLYNYDKVLYINNKTKVTITCPKHGDVMVLPTHFLKRKGCPLCSRENKSISTKNKTTEEFIENARKVHGKKYDYSEAKYLNAHSKIKIICLEHGEFWQLPYVHLDNGGCPICGIKNITKGNDEFLQEVHNKKLTKYICKETKYINNSTKVTFNCQKHGFFNQYPNTFLKGKGCPICAFDSLKKSQEEFINKAKEIHGDKYDYSKVKYSNAKEKVCIICPQHGEFWQRPPDHINGEGCPKCHESKLENEIRNLLLENKIEFEQFKRYPLLNNLQLDFFLPQYSIAIECQGIQHFQPVEFFGGENEYKKLKERDEIKKRLCFENNIKLLYYSNLDINYPYEVLKNKIEVIDKLKECKIIQ